MSTSSPNPDTLTLNVSEDFFQGDANFAVTVDGQTVAGTEIATASHADGASQDVTIQGNFGAGSHTVAVTFTNDAYSSSPFGDRNLYLNSVTLNQNTVQVNTELASTGDTSTTTLQGSPNYVPPAAPAQSAASGHLAMVGVNLDGADYHAPGGVLGYDYTYPSHSELDYYAAKGMNVIRLPLSLERLQSSPFGSLDGTQLAQIDDFVGYAAQKGITVDLDPHNYGYAFGDVVGATSQSTAEFADFWGKMASHFQSAPNVMFGLMNEPHEQTAAQWAGAAQSAINAIRATGAGQEILVPGTAWDGVENWSDSGNASVVGNVTDPNHNLAFEAHLYFDDYGKGVSTNVDSPNIGPERMAGMTQWAQETGNKLFLGELGAGQDPASLQALGNTLNYLDQHSNVWQGVTEFTGGPWVGDYMFSVEPSGGVDKPQLTMLSGHAPGAGA